SAAMIRTATREASFSYHTGPRQQRSTTLTVVRATRNPRLGESGYASSLDYRRCLSSSPYPFWFYFVILRRKNAVVPRLLACEGRGGGGIRGGGGGPSGRREGGPRGGAARGSPFGPAGLIGGGVGLWPVAAGPTAGCPFCTMQGQTLLKEVDQASMVL